VLISTRSHREARNRYRHCDQARESSGNERCTFGSWVHLDWRIWYHRSCKLWSLFSYPFRVLVFFTDYRKHAFWQPNTLETRGIHPDGSIRHNTYVIFENCNCLRGHRDLKRILLSDPELRNEYGEQKLWLVHELGVNNPQEYSSLKNDVVLKILRKAGWTDKDLGERREFRLRKLIEWDGKMDEGLGG